MKQVALITGFCLLSFAAAHSEDGIRLNALLQARENDLFYGSYLRPRADRAGSDSATWAKVKGTGPGLIGTAGTTDAIDPKFVEPGTTRVSEHHDSTSSIATAWAGPEGAEIWPNSNPSFKAKAQGRYVATNLHPSSGSEGRVKISKDGHTETHHVAGGGEPFIQAVESNRRGGVKVSARLDGHGSLGLHSHKDPAGPPRANPQSQSSPRGGSRAGGTNRRRSGRQNP